MWWAFQWVVIYILGGLTFVPLVVIAVIGYVMTYGSTPIGDPDPAKKEKARLLAQQEKEELLEKAKNAAATAKPLSGWLTVRRQFQPYNATTSIFAPAMAPSTSITGPTQLDTEEDHTDKDDASIKSGVPTLTTASTATTVPATYSARIAQTYRQMVEARQKKEAPPKEFLFAMLKGSVLFLYEDEAASECVAAIGINKYVVGIEGKDGGKFEGKDGEMFAKRNCIVMRIQEKDGSTKDGIPALTKGMGMGNEEPGHEEEKALENAPWFLFSKSNTKMEDWYLALTAASALQPTTTEVFSERDMQGLVDTIDTEPDPIPMRWLNAIFGRVFFGLYRTEALEQLIIGRIMKKLTKVPRPSFLGPIVIREVNVGTSSPIFSKPMLKELTTDGTASFEVHLNYQSRPNQPNSEIRITIATTATIPTGFKPYVVDLVLAVVIKSFEGNVVVMVKKPPSNRIWYGFTSPPRMEIEIQPVVSERKIQIGMILKAIEKQLRDVIAESVVLPNMDDIAFFDSSELDIRGGIFSSAGKVTKGPTADLPSGGTEVATQPGIDINAVSEGLPASVVEVSGIRQRVPAKAKTLDTHIIGGLPLGDGTDGEHVIPRNDTTPALSALSQSAKQASQVKPAKKWFTATGRPPSITSLASAAGFNQCADANEKPRSSSMHSMDRSRIDRTNLVGGQTEAISTTAEPVSQDAESLPVLSVAQPSPKKDVMSSHEVATRSISEHPGVSTSGGLDEHGTPISPASSTASTASLISSFRTRDKKAIQSQVNTARDTVKKWGVNWAAKARTNINALTEDEAGRPAPIYRPPDEDDFAGSSSALSRSKSPDGPKTLQDRLNAAAVAAAASRPKSSSVSSTSPIQVKPRPTLQPSPASKATIPALGSSPPQWTLSGTGPTVGIARDVETKPTIPSPPRTDSEALSRSLSGSRASHDRRGSTTTPVLTQPSAGKSMVVPRVPKRPGEVVGMGSSQAGFTRRISGGDDRERPQETPGLPGRTQEVLQAPEGQDQVVKVAVLPALPPKSGSPIAAATISGDAKVHAVNKPDQASVLDATKISRIKTPPPLPAKLEDSLPAKDNDGDDDVPLSNVRSTLKSFDDKDPRQVDELDIPDKPNSLKESVNNNPRSSTLQSLQSKSNNASAEDLLRHLVNRDQDRERLERRGDD